MLQALAEYETESEERAFLRGVVQGLMDLEEGREMDLSAVKIRLARTIRERGSRTLRAE